MKSFLYYLCSNLNEQIYFYTFQISSSYKSMRFTKYITSVFLTKKSFQPLKKSILFLKCTLGYFKSIFTQVKIVIKNPGVYLLLSIGQLCTPLLQSTCFSNARCQSFRAKCVPRILGSNPKFTRLQESGVQRLKLEVALQGGERGFQQLRYRGERGMHLVWQIARAGTQW